MIQIKLTSTLLFAVLLTGWVHFTSSQPHFHRQHEYENFIYGLELTINSSSPDDLPFWLKGHVIPNMLMASSQFKALCLQYDAVQLHNHAYTPLTALYQTIENIFSFYIRSANENDSLVEILESIKSMDPIGLNVFLAKNKILIPRKNPPQQVIRFINEYHATTSQRLRLFNMKTNDLCFDIFDGSHSVMPHNFLPQTINIPPNVRDEIATEYEPLSDVSIDLFIELISEKLSRQMYRVGTKVENYQKHISRDFDDVQIVYGTSPRHALNPICVHYRAFDKKVHVYDSLMCARLDPRQQIIVHKLYPFNEDIVREQPRTLQDKQHSTAGIFAIIYASMLVLGEDPAQTSIKLNEVYGDETLYMRIHILNMLANRELASLK